MSHSGVSGEPPASMLVRLAADAEREARERILPFWLKLRDADRGGFFGVATSRGRPLPSAEKGAVLHGRILWFLSNAHRRWPDPALKAGADAAYAFIRDCLVDREHGGVFWTVTAGGEPADVRKHLYAQAFCIYGLAAYHQAFNEPEALALAAELWAQVEARAADDRRGGFREAFTRRWRPDTNALMGRAGATKTFNAHFHLLEALDALLASAFDPRLHARLDSLLSGLMAVAFDEARRTFRQFFDAAWRPLDDGLSYGHDIEASWMLPAIARRSRLSDPADVEVALMGVAGEVLGRAGRSGDGLIAGRDASGRRDGRKLWWVQAEGMVGLLDGYERWGEPRLLAAADRLWRFIRGEIVDADAGEWREWAGPRGDRPRPLAHVWKCPYHNGRACLEVSERAARLAAAAA